MKKEKNFVCLRKIICLFCNKEESSDILFDSKLGTGKNELPEFTTVQGNKLCKECEESFKNNPNELGLVSITEINECIQKKFIKVKRDKFSETINDKSLKEYVQDTSHPVIYCDEEIINKLVK